MLKGKKHKVMRLEEPCAKCGNRKGIQNTKNGSMKCSKCGFFIHESYFKITKERERRIKNGGL